jgi:hypothetical protein
MHEFDNQLQKARKEAEMLEGLSRRVNYRIGELGKLIRALEALQKSTSSDNPIPQEVIRFLNTLPEPRSNGSNGATQSEGANPINKTHAVFKLFNEERTRARTSGEVFEALRVLNYGLSEEDVAAVLDRQARSGRLSKRGDLYSLSKKGAEYIERMKLNL